ncbi:MAG: UDP-3-O-acyl-N-acetylglucosamine deacetylase [Gammaproteobacteria bacterium]|nr:UDP-3-O-acyl-N-acetylglucosamine deacetylase [Gammaproteobacteria bacterium]
MVVQHTLGNSISATGIGLHTGQRVGITLRPAPEGFGIQFSRVDLNPVVQISARPENVGDTRLSTVLEKDGVQISTVEHLMAALAGLGIDNVRVDVDGPEVPIMDGSASPFVFLIESAGIVAQNFPREFIRILKPVEVRDGDKWARLEPADTFNIEFSIDFQHPVLRQSGQTVTFNFGTNSFIRDVSRARTFGFVRDVEALRAQGLILGGGLENAIVLDDKGILNEDKLRYFNEFVKHKVLDAFGDLYLLGRPIIGAFRAHKSGHSLNNRLIRTLLETSNWERITRIENSVESDPISASAGAL